MLKELRKEKGLTQMQLSELVGVKRNTIAMIEIGENKPSLELAMRLAKVLDCNIDDFVKVGEQ